jgi:SulP family sulfate permease
MLATVVGDRGATHDLAKGVLVGVLLSGFFFAHKVGQMLHIGRSRRRGARAHLPSPGQVFFRLGRALCRTRSTSRK